MATKKKATKKTAKKKVEKQEESQDFTLEELQECAENLQDVLEFDPPINSEIDNIEDLIAEIKEKSEEDIYETDELSTNTFRTLELIGVRVKTEAEIPEEENGVDEDESEETETDEIESDEELQEDETEEKEELVKEKPKKKSAGKKKSAAKKKDKTLTEKEENPPVKKRKGNAEALKKAQAAKKANFDPTKSNKAQVYLKWNEGKGETNISKLHKFVKGAVKETTIKNWLSGWAKGNNLPSIAKTGK